MTGYLKVVWTTTAKIQLKAIYEYYKNEKQTLQGAINIKNDILRAGNSVVYFEQYQKDEIEPRYRRIIVRHYKLLYQEKFGGIVILRIFSTHKNLKVIG